MADYKSAYLREMDRRGIRYLSLGSNIVRVSYSGENLDSIPILVIFDDDGDGLVQFACMEIASFKEDKRYAAALMACNRINGKFRWVRFYLDDKRNIRAEADAVVDASGAGTICVEVVRRMVMVIDEAYEELKKI